MEETNRGVSDQWAYVSSSENTDVVLEESYLHWEGVGAEDSSFLIMEICVDNKEGLVPNISYIPSESSCEFVVYLIKKNTGNVVDGELLSALSETDRLGVLRTETSCTGYKVQYFPQRSVEQGEYYLVFVSVDGCVSLQLSSFALNGKLSTKEMDTLAYNIDSTVVLADGTFKGNDTKFTKISWKNEAIDLNETAPFAVECEVKISKANIRAVATGHDDDSTVDKVILPEISVNVGEKYTLVAPEITNCSFLCWKTGLGYNSKVVSSDDKYTFTVNSGGKLLTAVYRNINSAQNTAVFYNGNGQMLESVKGENCVIPELPSMSGFGKAEYWEIYGDDEKYLPGNTVDIKGMMNFVAHYGVPDMISVEVTEGCTGGGKYSYGDVVTLTAPEKKGARLFNCWTDSNGEIVSFNSMFTFTAAFNCEFVAVYKDYLPKTAEIRKIQVSQNGVYTIVTFIGTEKAIERGVIFGENPTFDNFEMKKTMKTEATVFSIENQTGFPVKGYALFENGTVIYSQE